MSRHKDPLAETKTLMKALANRPPKPHNKMKIGTKKKKPKVPFNNHSSRAKPKNV